MSTSRFAVAVALPLALLTFALILLLTPVRFDNPAEASVPGRFTCDVTGVHDGDGPIYCANGAKIRLTAIAARELDETCRPGHPCPTASGAAAKAALNELAGRQRLQCEATGRSYGRVNAWCWRPDGTELNCAMVESGTAMAWPRYDPSGRLCDTSNSSA
ncbi:thermonuclease family protein [Pacificimonas sp. ICDLI1SI03]